MIRFDFNISEELFNQIKLMTSFYKLSVSKIEIGYFEMLKMKDYDHK